jgi:hypothetical protein
MRARITYQGGLTYTLGSRTYKKGEGVVTSDPAEIARAKQMGGFTVTVLPDDLPKPTAGKVKGKPAQAAAEEPEAEDEDPAEDDGAEEPAEDEEPAAEAPKPTAGKVKGKGKTKA